jgi:hypothetical protein
MMLFEVHNAEIEAILPLTERTGKPEISDLEKRWGAFDKVGEFKGLADSNAPALSLYAPHWPDIKKPLTKIKNHLSRYAILYRCHLRNNFTE